MATPTTNNESATTTGQNTSVLEPMDLHNTVQFDELLRQRVLCGWDSTASVLEGWRDAIDAGTHDFFWVVPPDLLPHQSAPPQRYAGHICMVNQTETVDGTLRPTRHVCELFILPEHRRGGLGKAAVRALEACARAEPYGSSDVKRMTLNAISKRYFEDESEEWMGLAKKVYGKLGLEMPTRGHTNEDWYNRMGYVKYAEQEAYPTGEYRADGTEYKFVSVSLRKELV
ncbi:hypothetical protein B0H66DRAFT_344742 [Apodospora peruviana]|uniref:N-acetyltransferase domain-containing protein n=1 Tax=Apodospora peruviana TaxID=516989 RepID=A0AAE0HYY1_9PEZI|nr:hypothetical protein B0H66DRAFT_344742 [Apodospora peruviana]